MSHEAAAGPNVGGLLLVCIGVLDHAVLPDEALAADVAGEGFLSGVEAHMATQVSLVVELLGADLALVGLVPSLLGQVLLQEITDKNVSQIFSQSRSTTGSWEIIIFTRHHSFIL